MPRVFKSSHVTAFADDTKVFKAIKSQDDVTEKISNWEGTTNMVFNSTKS